MISSIETNAGMLRLLGFVKSPLITRALDAPDAELEELVVVSSPFFPHKLANGYSNPAGSVVYAINGTRIRSLRHLVAVLRDLKDPFVTIEFDQKGGEALVFSRQAIMAATDEILTDNGVRAQGSPTRSRCGRGSARRRAPRGTGGTHPALRGRATCQISSGRSP